MTKQGEQACDERTINLLSKLCTCMTAKNASKTRQVLTSAVNILSDSGEIYVDGNTDQASIAASIQRQLVRTGIRDKRGNLISVRFAELHEELSRLGQLKRYSSLLKLLNGLSSYTKTEKPHVTSTSTALGRSLNVKNDRAALRKMKYLNLKERDDFQALTESDLIRDVIFVSQGIDGKYIKYFPVQDRYQIDPQHLVSGQVQELIQNLCEIGWLYRKLQDEISAFEHDAVAKGAIQQAFYSAVQDSLGNYYRMLAVLETKVVNNEKTKISDEPKITLRCLSMMLSEPMQQLRVLAILSDCVKGLKGGEMATKLYELSMHGDPYVKSSVESILQKICDPLFKMIRKWMFEGELYDPCGEFFIQRKENIVKDELWQEGYSLHKSMLPTFISDSLAKDILRTGKSINFLKRCCSEKEWGDFHSMLTDVSLEYGQEAILESFVAKVVARVDEHLMTSLFHKFRCGEHLLAIKRYLLLGQGDFIQCLMDLAGESLNEKAGVVSSYQLGSILESAIRSSVVQYDDPEILNSLTVQMMPHTSEEYGWDVFSLNYKVESPLTAVFTKAAMNKYLRVFNFLWRLKRIEHALSAVWQSMKPSVQLFDRVRDSNSENILGIKGEVRRCHSVRNDMSHFCMHLQYYIMFEVLEESWTEFEAKMKAVFDLDSLISAHEEYLNNIVEKALLQESSQALLRQLTAIFDLILRFNGFSYRVQEILLEAGSKRRLRSLRAEMETAQGNWGMSTDLDDEGYDIDCFPEDFLETTKYELDAISNEYRLLVDGFVKLFPTVPQLDLGSLQQKLVL